MKYKIAYTPLFQQDVNEVLDYITHKLKNPIAAHNFLDKLEAEILSISEHPTGFAPYPSTKERPLPYYPLRVRNFTAFYVIIGDTIEFRRLMYSRSDLASWLETS